MNDAYLYAFLSQARKRLVREIKYRRAVFINYCKTYPYDGICLPKEAMEQKNYILNFVRAAYELNVINRDIAAALNSHIYGWDDLTEQLKGTGCGTGSHVV
jgi:hypothetical protein